MRLQRSSGLVGHWKFNEKSGIIANDISRYRNTGTLTGATHLPIWSDKGIKFDGVNDYVNAGNGASLNHMNVITIEAWINSQNVYNSYQMLVTKSDGSASSSFELRFDSATGKISYTSNMGGVYYNTGAIGQVLLNNTWYHIVSTYDNSTIRLYNNGIKYFSIAKSGVIYTSSDNLLIGSRASGTQYFFDGSIDEVRIYNRALNTSEIKQNYEATKHKYI